MIIIIVSVIYIFFSSFSIISIIMFIICIYIIKEIIYSLCCWLDVWMNGRMMITSLFHSIVYCDAKSRRRRRRKRRKIGKHQKSIKTYIL